jgi:GntR family transcriptional regulator
MPHFEAPIDTRNGVPFYRQIIDRVMLGLADGTLKNGDKLPTVRSLAVELRVNPNTVARAYHDLEIVGVVETRPGSGTYIAAMRPRVPEMERQRQLEQFCADKVAKAQALGFSIDELVETLKELRRGTRHELSAAIPSKKKSKQSNRRTGS